MRFGNLGLLRQTHTQVVRASIGGDGESVQPQGSRCVHGERTGKGAFALIVVLLPTAEQHGTVVERTAAAHKGTQIVTVHQSIDKVASTACDALPSSPGVQAVGVGGGHGHLATEITARLHHKIAVERALGIAIGLVQCYQYISATINNFIHLTVRIHGRAIMAHVNVKSCPPHRHARRLTVLTSVGIDGLGKHPCPFQTERGIIMDGFFHTGVAGGDAIEQAVVQSMVSSRFGTAFYIRLEYPFAA